MMASLEHVELARELVDGLVRELVARGATFVVPIDAEKTRTPDDQPICFDWLVLRAIQTNAANRPANAASPLVIAVQHHKTEMQIPGEFQALWDELRESDLVEIENVSHWNMNSKRMEAQARWGDVLLVLGGSEGVLFLANLYHAAGKPVIPLNCEIGPAEAGARRIFNTVGLSSAHAQRLFRTTNVGAHAWINRINFPARKPTAERIIVLVDLLESLEPPQAFVVRLLNDKHVEFAAVEEFFATVVQPVVEDELGYRMCVVDNRQRLEYARLDEEIFAKLHRSAVVFADITGMRPNCFIELGYALGRGLPTMVMLKEGGEQPFDIKTLAGLHWNPDGSDEERRQAFREHWNAIRTRPPLVVSESLIP